jgi:hypothetical protein
VQQLENVSDTLNDVPKRTDKFTSNAKVDFLFALDIGFLFSNSSTNNTAKRAFVELRSGGIVTDREFGGRVVQLEFAGLVDGKRETDAIRDRSRTAEERGGKSIWARSILTDEAPYLFTSSIATMNAISVGQGVDAVLKCDRLRVRIFPRGTIAIEQNWVLSGTSSEFSIEDFIVATKAARSEAGKGAWSQLREMLQSLSPRHPIAGIDVEWASTDETVETFVRQHLIRHTMIFLDAPPGGRDGDHGWLDIKSPGVQMPVAGLMNLTQWYDIYAIDYVESVFANIVRNRRDEVYLTDNDCSIIILADYWKPRDTLEYYREDLLLATQFEISRLTHLRYLAYYLRCAPETHAALSSRGSNKRSALSFVLDVQKARLDSSYDHPAESLIQHGFTRRFLLHIGAQRGTAAAAEELDDRIARIARAIELRSGLDIASKTYITSVFLVIATLLLIVATVVLIVHP